MQDVLVKAGSFVVIIVMGYVFRRIGLFKSDDFKVLSKIVMKITFPAVIISNFAGKQIDPTMIYLVFMGLGCGVLYVALGLLINVRSSREEKAFWTLNFSGYNIGNFTLPFVQSFLGPTGVIVTSLFDTGNAMVCLGGSYGFASVIKDGKGFSFKKIGATLIRSVPFDCYIIMLILNLAKIQLPSPVLSLTQVVGGANSFVVMLMIGIGMQLGGDRAQIGKIAKLLSLRLALSAVVALVFYYLLPFPLDARRALVLLVFSPIGSAIPAFTADLKGDVGLSSALNSVSIICSLIIITVLLTVMLG